MMKIAVISTGDELLKGTIADTNAAWIASKIDELGLSVEKITAVGDDLEAISVVLSQAFEEFDLVIVGGGLGPTSDDLTADAAALALSKPIVENKEAKEQVETAFRRISRAMAEVNLKQARLPMDCEVLENLHGTAPGFSVNTKKGRAFFLPGVPSELMPMFTRWVEPHLKKGMRQKNRIIFKCFGRGESDIQTALNSLAAQYPEIKWSYRAVFPELTVSLEGKDAGLVETVGKKAINELGRTVFAQEDIDLPTAFGKELKKRNLTVATAESCTGGQIGHLITNTPGSSDYFLGGIIAYQNEVKANLLGVSRDMLNSVGAVSQEVVEAMAKGIRKTLDADIGIAVSGIAGPAGGTPEKPVGLVHFAVAHPNGIEHRQKTFHGYNRHRVKRISAWTAISIALLAITED